MELLTLGNLHITPETVEVHAFIDEITTILQPIIQSHSLRLETALPEQQVHIQVDRELMKSLALNLIDNSIKASSPKSIIKLAVVDGQEASLGQNTLDSVRFAEPIPADCVCLAVIDEGMGIPEEEIPQLTEPFYMLDKARTRKHGGAGLGLALCSEIAQAHNSQLVINSQPGAGTTVSILLKRVGSND
jgi:signal transduction histidine kinase